MSVKTHLNFKLLGSDLKDYQQKIVNYFIKSDKTAILFYLTVGSGKTLTSLACAVYGLEHNLFDEIIILSPKSIQDEFNENYKLLETFRKINKEFHDKLKLIAYNANNSQKTFEKEIQGSTSKKYLFIIDELHLFMRSVIKVHLEESEKIGNIGNCENIFEIIKNLKNKRVIGLTGTPSAKFPFEMIPFFNLNSSKTKTTKSSKDLLFPENIDKFENMYISKSENKLKNIKSLKSKLKGLICYYSPQELSKDVKLIKSKTNYNFNNLNEIEIEMSEKQYKKYLLDYYLELQETTFIKHRNIYGIGYGLSSTFHAKTFQDSIYYNDDNLNEKSINDYLKSAFVENLEKFKYPSEIRNIKVDKIHCPKLIKMYEDSKNIKGLCVFYFKFVDYGVKVMEKILKLNGYVKYSKEKTKELKSDSKLINEDDKINKINKLIKGTYCVFTGNESAIQKAKIKKIFNSYENRHGEIIKYMILSPSGSVGITLKNVRFLGIGSVEFNYSAIRQIMGRVNRLNSHSDLKPNERTLIQNIYISVKNKKYYNLNKTEINKLCSRTTYFPDLKRRQEKALCIERIIYQDSIYDDLINEEFRNILKNVSEI